MHLLSETSNRTWYITFLKGKISPVSLNLVLMHVLMIWICIFYELGPHWLNTTLFSYVIQKVHENKECLPSLYSPKYQNFEIGTIEITE